MDYINRSALTPLYEQIAKITAEIADNSTQLFLQRFSFLGEDVLNGHTFEEVKTQLEKDPYQIIFSNDGSKIYRLQGYQLLYNQETPPKPKLYILNFGPYVPEITVVLPTSTIRISSSSALSFFNYNDKTSNTLGIDSSSNLLMYNNTQVLTKATAQLTYKSDGTITCDCTGEELRSILNTPSTKITLIDSRASTPSPLHSDVLMTTVYQLQNYSFGSNSENTISDVVLNFGTIKVNVDCINNIFAIAT